jgi:hypothetical protein
MHSLLITMRKEQPYLTLTYLVRTAGTELGTHTHTNAMAVPASKLVLLNTN